MPKDDGIDVLPSLRRSLAVVLAAAVAVVAASARADNQPSNKFNAHGVTFSYPASWLEFPVSYEIQIGKPLWIASIGPPPQAPQPPANGSPPPSSQPASPSPNLVTLAAFHVSVAITKKNIGRYKKYFAVTVRQLAASLHGQLQSGPTRVNLASLPGYGFQITAQRGDGTILENHLVFAFKQKIEYFINCQHPQDDPLAPEIDSGCDQILRSFRPTK
ncbi:MAG: hypothetical protein WAQ33_06810 [Gaiellaceae bacterium]